MSRFDLLDEYSTVVQPNYVPRKRTLQKEDEQRRRVRLSLPTAIVGAIIAAFLFS
jgi:hypothetical protein